MALWPVKVVPWDPESLQWHEVPDDYAAVLDVSMTRMADGHIEPFTTLGLGPAWGEEDVDEFQRTEVWPLLERIETGQWPDDGWVQKPSGAWQKAWARGADPSPLPPDPFADTELPATP